MENLRIEKASEPQQQLWVKVWTTDLGTEKRESVTVTTITQGRRISVGSLDKLCRSPSCDGQAGSGRSSLVGSSSGRPDICELDVDTSHQSSADVKDVRGVALRAAITGKLCK
jgi:hypothetical protein